MRFPMLLVVLAAFAATTTAQTEAELKGYGAAYDAAKKALTKHPKDAKAKHAFVVAGDRFATASMFAPSLPPRVKYRQALRLYREVLKVEPTNHEAKVNSQRIVDVYKSMNRPVPN